MRLTFLGGVDEVGRLALLAEVEGVRLLLDYGMAPRDPPEFPLEAPPVDTAVLSHAHLDHAGMLPWFAGRYNTPILANDPSPELATILARDARKVARLEGYPQPYDERDIEAMGRAFRPTSHGDITSVQGVNVTLSNAGHIPGSSLVHVQGGGSSLLFTGDLNTSDSQLVKGAEPVACDVLVMEATYAGRHHPDQDAEHARFLDAVEEATSQGHTAIVPAFATGRTQEVLMVLAEAGYEPWVDGMGTTVMKLFKRHPGALRDADAYVRALRASRPVRGKRDRRRVTEGGEVVVTTSGMLEGGPVLYYLSKLRGDAGSRVLLTGYQVEGTNGRRLLEEGVMEIDGQMVRPAPPVDRFHLSSHADHDELVAFAEACDPHTVVLCHGEHREELAADLAHRNVLTPSLGDTVTVP